jgi:hypothetical protein
MWTRTAISSFFFAVSTMAPPHEAGDVGDFADTRERENFQLGALAMPADLAQRLTVAAQGWASVNEVVRRAVEVSRECPERGHERNSSTRWARELASVG